MRVFVVWRNVMQRRPSIGVRRRRSGSVILEYVLAFPVLLTLILACMQFVHILIAKQVVRYAAFCAARATLVSHEQEWTAAAQQAAEQVCAWVVQGRTAGENDKRIPGWGVIPGSGAVRRKTRVTVGRASAWNVRATVTHDFSLIFPFVGPMIAWGMDPWAANRPFQEQFQDETGNIGDLDMVRTPHIRLVESVTLPKPYSTVTRMNLPVGGW